MASPEKAVEILTELSNLADRGTRADILARALRTANTLLDADASSLVLAANARRGERLVLYAGSDVPASVKLSIEKSDVLKVFANNREPLPLPDLSDNPGLVAGDACPGVEAGPVLFIPVTQRDPLPGYLAIYRKRGRVRFSSSDTQFMLLLAAWLSSALENVRLSAGTERLAITDDLTEIYNFRYLKSALKRETRRANRFHQELSLLAIEIDGLAACRDTQGERQAHALVKEVAALLAQQVRSFDILGRHGDDAFLVVLPQTGVDGACEAAERMRAAVAENAFGSSAPGKVTVTLGVSSFPQDGVEADVLLAMADRALDQGRRQGHNCVATTLKRAA
ncbi:MAG TPA: sensor domain-containing diguanylate cyclase [Candidatus Eisenbacteria bacterium]|nr:sensor domain-containing diguanylate cyclase [Candidatus Eisenbacteria bacterium]